MTRYRFRVTWTYTDEVVVNAPTAREAREHIATQMHPVCLSPGMLRPEKFELITQRREDERG